MFSAFRLTMQDAVLKGIALGLVIAIMIGPVFFFILNTSMKKGFLAAALAAVGVMMSDAFFISLAYFGSSLLLYLNEHHQTASLTGGIVIAAYGIILIVREARVSARSLELPEEKSKPAVYLLKGFLLNSINPSVLLFWIVVAGTIPVKEQYNHTETFSFYACTLATILSTDMLKAWGASRLRNLITAGFLIWMNRIAGSVLIAYGASMILKAVNG
jgi:threonine/homoserine/homoserine lactone efflux protein